MRKCEELARAARFTLIDGRHRHREAVIVRLKSGHVGAALIRDLRGVIEREKSTMGLCITLEPPTRNMRQEAATGLYTSGLWPSWHGDFKWPRLQIRTIEDVLAKRGFSIPPRPAQFKQAEWVAAPTPGLTSPTRWSEAPSALDIPEAADERENSDDELEE